MPRFDLPRLSRRAIISSVGATAAAFGLSATAGRARQATPEAPSIPTSPAPPPETWDTLHRPLALPTVAEGEPCPRTETHQLVSPAVGYPLGSGPVFASLPFIGGTNLDLSHPSATGWHGIKAVWWVAPGRTNEPILVRGRRLDGEGEVRFTGAAADGTSQLPAPEMRIAASGAVAADPDGWKSWPSNVWVQEPGCYAIQLDGLDFSDVIAFQAVGKQPGSLTPVPPSQGLPVGLQVSAAVPIDPDTVRLALHGPHLLAIRLDVGPTQPTTAGDSGTPGAKLAYIQGDILWRPFPEGSMPQAATWDDGRHLYQLMVLDGALPNALSPTDLVALADAFAAAPAPDG